MKLFVYWVLRHLRLTLAGFMACLKIFYYNPKISEERLEFTNPTFPTGVLG